MFTRRSFIRGACASLLVIGAIPFRKRATTPTDDLVPIDLDAPFPPLTERDIRAFLDAMVARAYPSGTVITGASIRDDIDALARACK